MNSKALNATASLTPGKLGSFRKKAPGPLLPVLLWRLPKATRETSAKHFSNSCGKVVNIDYTG
jgi:hypothetical protein